MSSQTEDLKQLFKDVTGDETTITESQKETPSHEAVEDEEKEVNATIANQIKNDELEDTYDDARPSNG